MVMLVPMWQADNDTPDSQVFSIQPGEVALLVATGFARKRTRISQTEMDSAQFACLHRLIFADGKSTTIALEPCNYCDYMYAVVANTAVYDEPVSVNGRTVGLSRCDNTMLWALPGIYYLHLNDTTGIGKAQVWIDVFNADKLPLNLLGDFTGVCHA